MMIIFNPKIELNERIDQEKTAIVERQTNLNYIDFKGAYQLNEEEQATMIVIEFHHYDLMKVRRNEWEHKDENGEPYDVHENDKHLRIFGCFHDVSRFGLTEDDWTKSSGFETAQTFTKTTIAFVDTLDEYQLSTFNERIASWIKGHDYDDKIDKDTKDLIDMFNKMIHHDVHYMSDDASKFEAAKELFERYTKKLKMAEQTTTAAASSSS